jgi:hypothetical protein
MDENVVSQLNGQIRRELEKNFKSIDQEVISYLIGMHFFSEINF